MQYTSREVYLPGNHYTSRQVYEYISRQTNDPIVERKTCAVSGTQFPIFQSDLDFYTKISPTFAGITYQIPTPTLCPEERQRRRLSFRNERKLYRRQCDASKKSIISIYSPDKPYKVYDRDIRSGDSRDPMQYGINFDFNQTFTNNYNKLSLTVPRYSKIVLNSDNCAYTNFAGNNKNCYMIFGNGNGENENCMYSNYLLQCTNCIDCFNVRGSSNSLHCVNCTNCHQLHYCIDCDNCSNCINCNSLNNKSYCINNKQFTKDEYMSLIKKYKYIQLDLLNNLHILESENVIGNNITNSNNATFIYDCKNVVESKYIMRSSNGCENVYDGDQIDLSNYILEEISVLDGSNICFSNNIRGGCKNIFYSEFCNNSSNLFGCIGLRNKSYCIFNKQYTKEEYEIMVGKIIQHMQTTGERGEFFHPSLSPFGYNETVAQEYYELQNVQKGSDVFVLKDSENSVNFGIFGYHRSTYNADPSIPEGVQTIERKNYSDEQRNSLLQEDNLETKVFLCSVSARPYRLQKAEIEFYRKHSLPIPDKHPDVRHEERMRLRPGRTLFLRTCDCCGKEMLSVYDQEHEGKVYCEECYQKEVYG